MSETVTAMPDFSDVPEMLVWARRVLKVARGLAAFTRSTADDGYVEKAEMFLNVIEPIASEPWVGELLSMLIGLVKKGDGEAVIAKMKEVTG